MVMCMEGTNPYFTFGGSFWEHLIYCPGLVHAVQAGSPKAASFNRRKTQHHLDVTCDLGHSFQIGRLMAEADRCKKLSLKGNRAAGFLCLGGAAISQAPFSCTS